MEKKLKFTRTNTAAVKGIAVMFLVFYHSFSDKQTLWIFCEFCAAVAGNSNIRRASNGTLCGNFCFFVSIWTHLIHEKPI